VVIVDVLRAFTTTAMALTRGARKIVFTAEVAEALELRRRGIGDLCIGEVGGKRPPGFDYGNSPSELSRAELDGRTLIQSTRAGTVGVIAASQAEQLFVAALVNAAATAAAVMRERPALVTIVAMGLEARTRSDEDELCALYIRNLCEGRQPDPDAVRRLVLASKEAQKFGDPARPHFPAEDLEIALQIDSLPIVMRVIRKNGLLVAQREDGH